MPVSGSSFTLEHAQADGAKWCREVHALVGGGEVAWYYLAPADHDHTATMQARVALVNAMLADQETENNFERDAAPILGEMTIAEFGARLRERYQSATRDDACRLAYWLTRRINAGHITDAQCRNAFGLTNTQWNNFKANKLTPQHDAWAAVIAATGG